VNFHLSELLLLDLNITKSFIVLSLQKETEIVISPEIKKEFANINKLLNE